MVGSAVSSHLVRHRRLHLKTPNLQSTSRGKTLSHSTSSGKTRSQFREIHPTSSFDSNISGFTESTTNSESASSIIPILPHNLHLFEPPNPDPDSDPDHDPPGQPPTQTLKQPEHWGQSALSNHLYAHCKDLEFETKAEVATWCRKHIEVSVEWRAPAYVAAKTAGTKHCRLCGMERVRLFNAFGYRRKERNLLNARSCEIRGSCTCKTRFLRFTTK